MQPNAADLGPAKKRHTIKPVELPIPQPMPAMPTQAPVTPEQPLVPA